MTPLMIIGKIASFFFRTKIGRVVGYMLLIVAAVFALRAVVAWHDAGIRADEAAKCETQKQEMVSKASYDALQAVLEKTERHRQAAAQSAVEAGRRAEALRQAAIAKDATIQRLTAEAATNDMLTSPSEEDLKWSEQHR